MPILKYGHVVSKRNLEEWDGRESIEVLTARTGVRQDLGISLLDWFAYHSGQPATVVIQSGEDVQPGGDVYYWASATIELVEAKEPPKCIFG